MIRERVFGIPAEMPPDNLVHEWHEFGPQSIPVETPWDTFLVPHDFSMERFEIVHEMQKGIEVSLFDDERVPILADALTRRPLEFSEDGLGCWLLPLSAEYDEEGRALYPRLSVSSLGLHNLGAHRATLSVFKGVELIEGMHVDHLCRNHACCNPYHLEQVEPRVNTRRGVWARSHRRAMGEVALIAPYFKKVPEQSGQLIVNGH